MAGESIKCPHCECKVKIADVEKEDGFCPECGQLVAAASFQKDPYEQDDLDDEEVQDDYDDEYDHGDE